MFEQLFSNGKFKPLSEHRLKSMLSEEELELLDNNFPFKISVYLANGTISKSQLYCFCGNILSERQIKKKINGEDVTCSKSCAAKKSTKSRQNSIIEKFGSKENYRNYVKHTQRVNSIKKYGMPFQSTDSFKKSVKDSLIEKYGVDHNSKIESVKASRKIIEDGELVDPLISKKSREKAELSKSKWSKEKKDQIRQKIRDSKLASSDVDHSVLNSVNFRIASYELAEKANCSVMTAWRSLKNKGLMEINYTQNTIIDYVKSLGFDCFTTRKVISPYELDIYIPEKKIAIEYNGIYWHSSNNKSNDSKFENYHLMKTEMCEEKGIQLLHIFENEWIDPVKREIWKSVIKHKLGLSKRIYARKCSKRHISYEEANNFCDTNHLQGKCIGANECIGLFYNDELVQVAIFGKSRYRKDSIELFRMCSKLNTIVIGGASKLTKNKSFISYGNRRWCSLLGNVYTKMAKIEGISKPCYWYIHKNKLYHRSSFMKHKLKDRLDTYDKSLTEVENCYNNGLRRIWDCGNLIYKV